VVRIGYFIGLGCFLVFWELGFVIYEAVGCSDFGFLGGEIAAV
jgi:hypothetical protein